MTRKEILYKCKIGNKKPFPADSEIPLMMNKIIVYHDESLPDGLFPECQKCLTGKSGSYIKFDEKGNIDGHGKFKECAIKQIPIEEAIFSIERVQRKFKESKCPLCKEPIREIWFLRMPSKNDESVNMHHILEKREKMVFGVKRMAQPNPKSSYTNCKIPNAIMEGTEHIKDVKKLQKLMDTKRCPKCGKQIDAIELKLMFTQDGAIELIHSTYSSHTSGSGYSYTWCTITNDEFHDLLFT